MTMARSLIASLQLQLLNRQLSQQQAPESDIVVDPTDIFGKTANTSEEGIDEDLFLLVSWSLYGVIFFFLIMFFTWVCCCGGKQWLTDHGPRFGSSSVPPREPPADLEKRRRIIGGALRHFGCRMVVGDADMVESSEGTPHIEEHMGNDEGRSPSVSSNRSSFVEDPETSLAEGSLDDFGGYLLLRGIGKSSSDSNEQRRVANMCAICLCPYDVGDVVVWSSNDSCKHAYHEECCQDWFARVYAGEVKKSNSRSNATPCPLCRSDFTDLHAYRRERRIEWHPERSFDTRRIGF